MKRAFDIVAGIALLLLAAPLFAIVTITLKARRGGSVLFSQPREGRDGERFCMWKFRTMVPDGDEVLAAHLASDPAAREQWDRYFCLTDDPRIDGRTGWWMRRLSLDELPQLWNVVRGDMSLVGPRPLPGFIIETLPASLLGCRRSVRPGMTGLWQVAGRSDLDIESMIELDSRYVTARSFSGDLAILLRTPRVVVQATGAH